MKLTSLIKMFFGDPISAIINMVIIFALIYVMGMIAGIKRDMKKNEDKISELFSGKSIRREIEKDATMRVVTGTKINPKDINYLRQEYDQICVKYSTISQLIPIFPSLGILGTVTGLMYQVQAEGLEEMTGSIALALSSTFLALLFTVILKYYMAVSVSERINKIEVKYRDYERYRQDLVDGVKLQEE